MRFSIVNKLTLGAAVLILLSISVTSWVFYTKTAKLLVDGAIEALAIEMRTTGDAFRARIDTQNSDLLFLAGTPPIQGLLRSNTKTEYDEEGQSTRKEWKKRLQSIFKTMLGSKPSYLKIRFINTQGQELVVTGRDNGTVSSVAESGLQNKSKREYVKKTLELPIGSIYLSEINLNREYGKVSLPHQEVLRTATPIYNEISGDIEGVLVITAEIGGVFTNIQNNIHNAGQEVFITNDRGGFLLHPDKDKAYGFDLGKRFRVQEETPELSELYLPDNNDTQVVLRLKNSGAQHVINFTKLQFDPYHLERFIAVGITEPYSEILDEQEKLLDDVVSITFLLAIITTLIATYFAYRISAPIKEITGAMEAYTHENNITSSLPTERHDEIGVLARSFNSLMMQVSDARQGLVKMNRSLENRVAERTQSLEQSDRRQRSIVNNMADGFITIDDLGIVLSFNHAAVKIFGYQPEEIIGGNVNTLMPEPHHGAHDGYFESFHQTGIAQVIGVETETEGRRKNGEAFPLELAISEIESGNEKIYTAILRDITERKQVERMKNEFISTVSHELRTPLTSIRGALGLITGGAVGELPSQISDMLTIAGNNTQRLLFLINDILDMQKIEAGQMIFNFQSLELSKFIEEAMENNATYAKQYGVTFSIKNNLSDIYVFADRERLMQVMVNLLSNAAKFSPEGGVVQIDVARHGGSIRISITDSGKGIPDNFHSKVFEKFTQSDSSDTRQKGGTGLGLSISKIIVERHQGLIDFVTNKNIGTTFFFELSELLQSSGNVNIGKPAKVPMCHSPCVLIAENDNDAAILLQRMLLVAGYNADIVNTVSQARLQLKAAPEPYKLIALDINLSEQNGVSFIEELRTNEVTRKIPVVVISAEVDDEKLNLDGSVLDLIDWMKCPIDNNRLLDVVRQVVGKSEKTRVLHIEDETDVQRIVSGILDDFCDITCASTLAESNKILDSEEFDVVLLDIGLPDGSGLDLLDKINKQEKTPAVVIFSAYEVASSYKDKVSAVLMKSTTDNFMLVEVINSIISQRMHAVEAAS